LKNNGLCLTAAAQERYREHRRRAERRIPKGESMMSPSRLARMTLAFSIVTGAAQAQAPLVAEGCIGCHGPGGTGIGGVPALAGRNADDLRAMLVAFRANERPGTIMGRVARGYTDAEIAAVADHFSRQR
jgi:cytochrome subunit of sulfide dehydrogenase